MACKSFAFALALGVVATAAAPVHADDPAGKISGGFTDAYEGLRDGILDAYDTSRKGTIEKWNDLTGTTEPAAYRQPSAMAIDVQRELIAAGYSPGPIDGRYGPMTSKAIRSYQFDNNLAQDGMVSQGLLDDMQTKRINMTDNQATLPEATPVQANLSEAECVGEWNYANFDHDGVLSSHEAGMYFQYRPMPGYREIPRAIFVSTCRDGTLSKTLKREYIG